jgi:hypothetical protein
MARTMARSTPGATDAFAIVLGLLVHEFHNGTANLTAT